MKRTWLTKRPATPESRVDGQWMQTACEEIADGQVNDEHIGRCPQPFKSGHKKK